VTAITRIPKRIVFAFFILEHLLTASTHDPGHKVEFAESKQYPAVSQASSARDLRLVKRGD
jgi:hypothetical protein